VKCIVGVWVLTAPLHYSTIPILQSSSLSRRSEAIERNEAYESFSAACYRTWECL
jgi:hypothetical protein